MTKLIISSLVIPALMLLGFTTTSPASKQEEDQLDNNSSTASTPKCSIHFLPREILKLVLGKLDLKSIINTSKACKTMHKERTEVLNLHCTLAQRGGESSIGWVERNLGSDAAAYILASCDNPDDKESKVMQKLAELMPEGRSLSADIYADIKEIFKTISPESELKSPIENKIRFLSCASKFVSDSLKGGTLGMKALAKVPNCERDSLVSHILYRLPDNMDGDESAEIIAAFNEVPAANRQGLGEFVGPFFTEDMDGNKRTNIIISCGMMTTEDRKSFEEFVEQFCTEGMGVRKRAHLMAACNKVPAKNRKGLKDLATPFFTEDMGAWKRGRIIAACGEVTIANRQGLVKFVKPFLTEDMGAREIAYVIVSCGEVAIVNVTEATKQAVFTRREKLEAQLQHWRETLRKTEASSGKKRNKSCKIQHAANICRDLQTELATLDKRLKRQLFHDRRCFEEFVKPFLTEDMDGEDSASIIRVCSKVPVENREGLKVYVEQFCTKDMEGTYLARFIEICGKVPTKDRESFKEFVETFLIKNMKEFERSAIMAICGAVPVENRKAVTKVVMPCFKKNMNGLDRAQVIKAQIIGVPSKMPVAGG